MSLEERTRAASNVVLADVVSVRPRASTDPASPAVETVVRLTPVASLKGASADVVEIVIPGGELPGVAVWSPDSPVFVQGRRALVFLDDRGRVVGGAAGRLDVASGMVAGVRQPWAHVRDRVLIAAGGLEGPILTEPVSGPAAAGVSAAGPVISAITPGSASAGTRSRVAISGSGFGSSQGAGRVEFFYRSGRNPVAATTYVSWSDSVIVVEVPIANVDGYPAAAGSGPVTVTDASGATSPGHDFEVTFAFGGMKWPNASMGYRVAAPSAGFEAMVDAATATWSSASAFRMNDEGTIAGPTSTTNDVYWTNLAEGDLGRAFVTYMPGAGGTTGTILACDFAFNNSFPWGDGSGDTFDVQSVALHELGHWLNLRDLYGPGDIPEVMYGVGTRGTQKRGLHAHDIAGIRYIYGAGWAGLDSRPPTTTITGVPGAWTSQTVSASLTATDDVSGVLRTYYRIGSSSAYTYTAPLSFSADQNTTLWYWSEDNARNVEVARSAPVRVDRTAPVTTSDARTFHADTAVIALSAADGGSGVASTAWRLDGGALHSGALAVTTALGPHVLEFRSTDVAGNREVTRTASFTVVESGPTSLERLSGADRYRTAVKVSERSFATASVVVLATGASFPDALSAAGLAGALDAPVLLSRPGEVPAEVIGEIRRLGATRIVAIGGSGALSDDALSRAASKLGITWTRVAGVDRYSTAAAVARAIRSVTGSAPPVAMLVRGDGFADALAASPYAYSLKAPILLTLKDAAPAVTVAAARTSGAPRVVVVGGSGVVSDEAARDLALPWTRAAGANRYATAVRLTRYAMSQGWTLPSSVGIAAGDRFPDALAGGAAIGGRGGALLLTRRPALSPDTAAFLADCIPAVRTLQVYGGEAAISSACYSDLAGYEAP